MLDRRLERKNIFVDQDPGLRSQLVEERARHVESVGASEVICLFVLAGEVGT
jgi:hypothetical protein